MPPILSGPAADKALHPPPAIAQSFLPSFTADHCAFYATDQARCAAIDKACPTANLLTIQGGHKPCAQTFATDQFDHNLLEEKKAESSFFNCRYSKTYLQGVHPSIRGEVWEFLLGCYDPQSTFEERE